jgi:RNA polymerase sigma factor (sigma-70 family)
MGPSGPAESNSQFRALLLQVGQGSEDAARELVRQYAEALRRTVRRILNVKLQPLFDSLDFVQLVWSSLFRYRDRIETFQTPEELAAFLTTLARRKVRSETYRRLCTDKRNVNRERPLDPDEEQQTAAPLGQSPEPSEIAIANERWDRLLAGQSSQYRRIIQLRLQGHTHEDIADILGISTRSVGRFLKQLLSKSAK